MIETFKVDCLIFQIYLRTFIHSEQYHWSNLFEKSYLTLSSPFAHIPGIFTNLSDPIFLLKRYRWLIIQIFLICLSDLIRQIKLIVLSFRIRLRTSIHSEQYYWLIYLSEKLYPFQRSNYHLHLSEKLYPFQAFLLDHILDQFLVFIFIPNCDKLVQSERIYPSKPICTQNWQ